MKIGVLGGSFDPIHMGHLVIGEEARHSLGLSKVIFVPANIRPHKKNRHCAPARDRLAMVKLAVRGHHHFEVSDIEIRRQGVSYTVDTLRALKKVHGAGCRIFFIIGSDTLPELPTWKDVREVARLCTFGVAARPGMRLARMDTLATTIGRDAVARMRRSILRVPLIGISSSDIRERVASGRPISAMTPKPVADYLRRKGLYRG